MEKKKLPVPIPTIQVVDIWLFRWSKSNQGTNNRRPWIFLSVSWGPTNNSILSLSPYASS